MIMLTELLNSLFPAVLIKSVKESESLFIRNPHTPRRGLQALSLKLKLIFCELRNLWKLLLFAFLISADVFTLGRYKMVWYSLKYVCF